MPYEKMFQLVYQFEGQKTLNGRNLKENFLFFQKMLTSTVL